MLKQLAAFILLSAFAFQTFSKVFIVVDYYVNTSAFAKDCENKARPLMQCNGKCQMNKKIQKEEKKDQQNPDRRGENKNEIALFPKSFFDSIKALLFSESTSNYLTADAGREIKMHRTIFHPPCA